MTDTEHHCRAPATHLFGGGEQANHHARAISLKAQDNFTRHFAESFASAMTQTRNDRTKVPSDR